MGSPSQVRPIAFGSATLALAIVLGLLVGEVDLDTLRRDPRILELRLPRVLLGAIAGGGLGVVGAALQTVFRNPIADPFLLGVSGGSALGATTVIAVGLASLPLLGSSVVPIAAFAGGLVATLLVYTLAGSMPKLGTSRVIFAGILVNALASSLITFAKTLVSAARTQELLYWLMGFVDVPSLGSLLVVLALVATGCTILLLRAPAMNVLSLGSRGAASLGIRVRRLEFEILVASSLIVGAIVSVTGMIGFVGLVVPQALRRVLGPDARRLLPTTFLMGGALLVLSDALARLSSRFVHTIPPVGAVTALLAAPAVVLVLRPARRHARESRAVPATEV